MLWCVVLVASLAATSAFNLPGVPIAFTEDTAVLSAISDDVAKKFADEYIKYKKTGVESAALRQIARQLSATFTGKDLFTKSFEEMAISDLWGTCTVCRSTMRVMTGHFLDEDGAMNGPNAEEDVKAMMLDICDYMNLQTPEVCAGLFDINWPIADYIMQNSVADTRSICGSLPIDICNVRQEEFNWSLNISDGGVALTGPKADVPMKTDNDLKILQVTDIHYDPKYQHGALADCEEPLCCRVMPSSDVNASLLAGYWSDYRDCDTPLHMIEDAFDHIAATHTDIDYIYHTGDVVPHEIWATTKEGNMEIMATINDLLEAKFPNVPVYSCVGNHESHPTNVFSSPDMPESLNVQWLYQSLYKEWSKWLPSTTEATILEGGYYTVVVKEGLRLIALNSMECYMWNWWVFYDGSFAMKQLQWLHDTLLAAEAAGEHVHILSHVPSGSSECWTVWAREFNRIIERFNPIISGIFGGHTHKDELNVHYSEHGHAMAINWNGGSLTSYSNKNPNYNVYEVEPATWQVVDYETWIFDLVAANEKGAAERPVWFKEYTFSEEFTHDLSPAGLNNLLEEMAASPALLRKFWRYKFTSAEPKMTAGCDNSCLSSTLCRMAMSVYDQKDRCNELKALLEPNLGDEETTASPPEVTTPKDDGAASIVAFRLTTIVAFIFAVKFLL